MISAILEIVACVIAAVFGCGGVILGLHYSSNPLVACSGALVAVVVIYLSMLAEVLQGKALEKQILVCKVLNKLIYVTIIGQVITASTMV